MTILTIRPVMQCLSMWQLNFSKEHSAGADQIARFGGDEFCILLTNLQSDGDVFVLVQRVYIEKDEALTSSLVIFIYIFSIYPLPLDTGIHNISKGVTNQVP